MQLENQVYYDNVPWFPTVQFFSQDDLNSIFEVENFISSA